MPVITILGQAIDFPDSAQQPNWAPAVIEFAQAVEDALNAAGVGTFDVPPQVLTIDAYNPGINVNINALAFPTSAVRGAFIRYAVFRTTSTANAYEIGTLNIVYNPNNPVGDKWEITREFTGDGQITFDITDDGQITFSTLTLSGINHQGKISFSAQSLLQS